MEHSLTLPVVGQVIGRLKALHVKVATLVCGWLLSKNTTFVIMVLVPPRARLWHFSAPEFYTRGVAVLELALADGWIPRPANTPV